MDTQLFTPRHFKTGERLQMQISDKDRQVFDENKGEGMLWIPIFDFVTKQKYLVKSADCGSSCHCDAVYKQVGESEELHDKMCAYACGNLATIEMRNGMKICETCFKLIRKEIDNKPQ